MFKVYKTYHNLRCLSNHNKLGNIKKVCIINSIFVAVSMNYQTYLMQKGIPD